MKNENFSVVIPLYNKRGAVEKTLRSVLSQTYPYFEVIVVDDGSTDGSADVVCSIKDDRLRIVRKTNGGVSSARNRGLEEARYEYIAFLDADDIWEPFFLEEQVKLITDFPEADMWALGWGYMKNGRKIDITHYPVNYRGYINNYWAQRHGTNIFFVCVCVCRRSALLAIGGYDERIAYGEDLDVSYRMLLHGKAAYNSTVYGMYYVQDAENRAMQKTIPLERYLPFYIEKYADARYANPDFRKFVDKQIVAMIYPYVTNKQYIKDITRITDSLNLSELSPTDRLQLQSPRLYGILSRLYQPLLWLKRQIYKMFVKN